MDALGSQAEPSAKACHNCRRSRRVCDRSFPTCNKCYSLNQACLGYGTILNWTNSVASRGKLMGKTFDTTHTSTARRPEAIFSSSTIDTSSDVQGVSHHATAPNASPVAAFYEPIDKPPLEEMSKPSRFYLDYYDKQVCKDLVLHDSPQNNPFRELLSLSSNHRVLQQIVVANSALHYARTAQRASVAAGGRPSTDPLAYQDALIAKNQALRLLSVALTSSDVVDSDVVLASIMLFIKFELLDSGTNSWRFHTDGARQLMKYLRQNGKSQSPTIACLRRCLMYNCVVYDILGTTFTASNTASGADMDLLSQISMDVEVEANVCLSCPPILLQVIRDVPYCTRVSESKNSMEQSPATLLFVVEDFDPRTWAQSLEPVSESFDLELRTHIGFAYKAAVKIYVLRATVLVEAEFVALEAESVAPDSLDDLVSHIIVRLDHIAPDNSYFKAICWPSFVAGAETNDPEQRAWVLTRFEKALQTLPWGYLSSAIDVLHQIWARKDNNDAGANWLVDLKSSETDWLIA